MSAVQQYFKKAKHDRQLTASKMRCAVCMLPVAEILLVAWRDTSVVRRGIASRSTKYLSLSRDLGQSRKPHSAAKARAVLEVVRQRAELLA